MKIRVRMDLAFDILNQNQAEQLRDAIIPFANHAVPINEGKDDEERGFIDVEKCRHDEGLPCEKIARWEVGRGRIL